MLSITRSIGDVFFTEEFLQCILPLEFNSVKITILTSMTTHCLTQLAHLCRLAFSPRSKVCATSSIVPSRWNLFGGIDLSILYTIRDPPSLERSVLLTDPRREAIRPELVSSKGIEPMYSRCRRDALPLSYKDVVRTVGLEPTRFDSTRLELVAATVTPRPQNWRIKWDSNPRWSL